MSRHAFLAIGAAMVALAIAPVASAQSLGDIARKEAERRGTAPTGGSVYTNGNLTPDFTKPPAPVPATEPVHGSPEASAAAAVAGAPKDVAGEGDTKAAEGESKAPLDEDGVTPRDQQEPQPVDDKDENFWRNQAKTIKARVANQNAQIEQLRTRLESFPPGAANSEKALVQQTMQKAVADLKFLNDEWLRFERSARERKIPEAWIR